MYSTDNLRSVLEQATADEWREGTTWYRRAHRFINELSGEFGLPTDVVAGVVAALSPMNKWGQNCQDARNLISAFAAGKAPEDVKVCTFNSNKARAWDILTQRDRSVLSGQKVMAFCENLTGNLEFVTVDRHAYNAAIGHREVIGDGGHRITENRYRAAAATYTALADEVGLAPAQLQAIVWLAWRRLNVPSRFLDD